MRNRMPLGLAAVGLGCSVWTAVALAAPANTKLPTISGKPAYGSTLTCKEGTWSADATRFDYSWVGDGGFPVYAKTQKWHVNSGIGYAVHCQVVAHDAAGATTAANTNAVQITNGISSVRFVKLAQRHGNLTFTFVGSPTAAFKHKSFDRASATVYRKQPHDLLQITFGAPKFGKKGRFTLTGHDTPGTHTYVVQFVPAGSSQYGISHASKRLTIKR